MNIIVYIFRKKVDKDYKNAIEEYRKRLSKYCKTNVILTNKKENIITKLKKDSYKIKIEKNIEQLTSEELAEKIEKLGIKGVSTVEIILGEVDIDVDFKMELTQMDIELDLEGVLLFEQIYRSYKIIKGEVYHK